MRVSCVQAVAGGESRPVKTIGGSGFQSEEFGRLSQTASAAIESQVLVPIKRWLDVFNALSARMKEVEALRLEVDSRRHTVIDLAASVDKQRARLGKVGDTMQSWRVRWMIQSKNSSTRRASFP